MIKQSERWTVDRDECEALLVECSASHYDRLTHWGSGWLLTSCFVGVALASASNGSRECLSATVGSGVLQVQSVLAFSA